VAKTDWLRLGVGGLVLVIYPYSIARNLYHQRTWSTHSKSQKCVSEGWNLFYYLFVCLFAEPTASPLAPFEIALGEVVVEFTFDVL
jgi:hypothetical protein